MLQYADNVMSSKLRYPVSAIVSSHRVNIELHWNFGIETSTALLGENQRGWSYCSIHVTTHAMIHELARNSSGDAIHNNKACMTNLMMKCLILEY